MLRLRSLNKASGPDMIVAEVLKALGDAAVDVLHGICNTVFRTGVWPQDWSDSTNISMHRKGYTKKFETYPSLLYYSRKRKLLIIINSRLWHLLYWQISPKQPGFVNGYILNIKQIIEKCYEYSTLLE